LLSSTSKYALRALLELASAPEGATVMGKDLSRLAGVPSNYLSKILWTLGGEGIIEATRGVRGGYRLKQRPCDISLLDIVKLFDKPRFRQSCFLHDSRECSDTEPCAAHQAWFRVGESNRRFLETTTLEDIACEGSRKKRRRGD
jgi:Rrf2 family protein